MDPNIAAEEAANIDENFANEEESVKSRMQKLMMRAMRKMKAIAAQVLMTAILIIVSILK